MDSTELQRRNDFPGSDFFQFLGCVGAYYDKSMTKPFKCFLKTVSDMITEDTLPAFLIQKIHESIDDTSDMFDNNHTLTKWIYEVSSYYFKNMYGSAQYSYDEYIQQYNRNSIKITTWSHPCWKLIHYFAAKYEGKSSYSIRLNYKAFVSCLQFILPCSKCRVHLKTNLAQLHIDEYFNAKSLFVWSYKLHQTVNTQLNKKGITLTNAKELHGL